MAMASRKTSRTTVITNNVKPLGIPRQTQDPSSRKSRNLTVDGESKFAPVSVSGSSSFSKRHSLSENVPIILNDQVILDKSRLDHTQCKLNIQKLEEQVTSLLQDKCQLKVDLKVVSAELSLEKQEKEKIKNDIDILQQTNDELVNENRSLRNGYESISEEFETRKNIWDNEKTILEKALGEIRKELEDKIVEIRAKHKDEVLSLEEKVRILKVRLADNLKINSWERQQEIDRIANDLERSLVNEENLKLQLNRILPQLSGETMFCHNCHTELGGGTANSQKKEFMELELNILKTTPNDIKRGGKGKLRLNKSADVTR